MKSKTPHLAETYQRLFGKLPEEDHVGKTVNKPVQKQVITESQMKTWLNLHRSFKSQNPNRTLVMSEGAIKLDGFVVESADKFLKRDLQSMVQVLRNAARSINKK